MKRSKAPFVSWRTRCAKAKAEELARARAAAYAHARDDLTRVTVVQPGERVVVGETPKQPFWRVVVPLRRAVAAFDYEAVKMGIDPEGPSVVDVARHEYELRALRHHDAARYAGMYSGLPEPQSEVQCIWWEWRLREHTVHEERP